VEDKAAAFTALYTKTLTNINYRRGIRNRDTILYYASTETSTIGPA
jgi:hypothetical protein